MKSRVDKSNNKTISLPARWLTPESDALFGSIVALKSLEDARRFFRDLLTEKEIVEFSRRFKVARMLSEGYKYDDIEDATGMSSTTIARISQWLNSGMGGYRSAIARSHHHPQNSTRRGLS